MYREPSEEQVKGRVGLWARRQVITGAIFVIGGVAGFLATQQWALLVFVPLGVAFALIWNPIRRSFDDEQRPPREEDLFPGGKL